MHIETIAVSCSLSEQRSLVRRLCCPMLSCSCAHRRMNHVRCFSRVDNSRFWLTAQELSSLLKTVFYRFGCLCYSSGNLRALTTAECFGVSKVGNKMLTMFVSSMFVVWRRLSCEAHLTHTTNAAFATAYVLLDDLYTYESSIYFMLCAGANFSIFRLSFCLFTFFLASLWTIKHQADLHAEDESKIKCRSRSLEEARAVFYQTPSMWSELLTANIRINNVRRHK